VLAYGLGAMTPVGDHDDEGTPPLRVVVADDDAVARALICEVIANETTLDLVGVAHDAGSVVQLAVDRLPDVAVLDWMMPGGGGPQASREILQKSPETQVVALTASDTQEASIDMLRAGAKSILIKGTAPEEIVRTIHVAMRL